METVKKTQKLKNLVGLSLSTTVVANTREKKNGLTELTMIYQTDKKNINLCYKNAHSFTVLKPS
jgi:hypothetical protein